MLALRRDWNIPPSIVFITCSAKKSGVFRGGPGRPIANVDWAAPGLSTRKMVVAFGSATAGKVNDGFSPPLVHAASAFSMIGFAAAVVVSPTTVTRARPG